MPALVGDERVKGLCRISSLRMREVTTGRRSEYEYCIRWRSCFRAAADGSSSPVTQFRPPFARCNADWKSKTVSENVVTPAVAVKLFGSKLGFSRILDLLWRRVLAVFTRSAITRPEVNRFG